MTMTVYTGAYDVTLTNVQPADVETSDIELEELQELVASAKILKCSPIVRDVRAKAEETVTALQQGKKFSHLDVAEQFNARTFRAIMRKHAREMSAMITETTK